MQLSALRIKAAIRRVSCPGKAWALAAIALLVSTLSLPASAQIAGAYKVTNLISDGSVPAAFTDPTFINPWAISDSGTWWISSQGSGQNFVIASTPTAGTINFKVNVPQSGGLATPAGLPTGSVTTGGATGMILPNGTKASFLFCTLDGTISGWNSKLGTAGAIAQIAIDNKAAGAEYTGLTIINSATASYILAANFGTANAIEVYDGTFKAAKLAGSFTDPNLPAGYSPFSVHVLNNQVWVAYAVRSASAPYHTIDALGNGVVDVFDASGNFLSRAATGGNLNSPWGVAIAPANFGVFGGSLLIGNFANGLINAYDPVSFAYRGQMIDSSGNPLSYASLWELLPGGTTVGNTTGVSGGNTSSVYFTAGLAGEAHGLFGAIANDTSAGTPAFGLSSSTGTLTVKDGGSAQTVISVAPVYGFTGAVTLSCKGLPVSALCSFSPAQISSTGTAPATATLTISTTHSSALLRTSQKHGEELAYAFLLPFASILVFYRRRSGAAANLFRLSLLCMAALVTLGTLTACGNFQATPTGSSTIIVSAASGSTTQSTSFSLVVQ